MKSWEGFFNNFGEDVVSIYEVEVFGVESLVDEGNGL